MQKFLVSIILVSYFALSSGIIVNSHFCMNRLASKEVFGSKQEQCGKCGMHKDKADGCCHDEVTLYKISSDQKTPTSASFNFELPAANYFLISDYFEATVKSDKDQDEFPEEFPPPRLSSDLYLQYCVFRI